MKKQIILAALTVLLCMPHAIIAQTNNANINAGIYPTGGSSPVYVSNTNTVTDPLDNLKDTVTVYRVVSVTYSMLTHHWIMAYAPRPSITANAAPTRNGVRQPTMEPMLLCFEIMISPAMASEITANPNAIDGVRRNSAGELVLVKLRSAIPAVDEQIIVVNNDTFVIKHARTRTSLSDTATVETQELWHHGQRLSLAHHEAFPEVPVLITDLEFNIPDSGGNVVLTVRCANATVHFEKKNGVYEKAGGYWDVSEK